MGRWRWNLYSAFVFLVLGMVVYGLCWTGTLIASTIYDCIFCFFYPPIPTQISTFNPETLAFTLDLVVEKDVKKVEEKNFICVQVGVYCLVLVVLCVVTYLLKPKS